MNPTAKHFKYLDSLRESGVTNMYGAAPYLNQRFPDLSREQASKVLVAWMKTFGDGTASPADRAAQAQSEGT